MTSLTIHKFPKDSKQRLKILASLRGKTQGQFARELLEQEIEAREPELKNLAELAERIFGSEDGVDLELSPREPLDRPSDD